MRQAYLKAVAISMTYVFAVQLVLPFLAPYFSSLGYTDQWISFVFGLFPLATMLVSIFIGELSDELGRYWLIFVALLGNVAAYGLYFWGVPAGIVLGRIVDALCFATVSMLLLAKVQDSIDDSARGRKTGLVLSLEYGAKLIAPVAGGILADRALGYPFLVSIGILLALALTLRGSRLHRKTDRIRVHPLRSLRWFASKRELRPLLFLGPAMHAAQPAMLIFIPLLVTNTLGLSYESVGLLMAVWGVGHIFQFLFGDISDRYGRRRFVLLGTGTIGACIVAAGLLPLTYSLLLGLAFVWGIGSALWNVVAWSHMSDVAEKERKEGVVVGTYLSVAKVGGTLGFFAAGSIAALWGYEGVFLVLGGVALLGTAVAGMFFLADRLRFRMAAPLPTGAEEE